MGQLYTIGHSQHPFDFFIQLLKAYNVNYILDVRSTPYSKYAEAYNRNKVEKRLQRHEIRYWFMGNFFGARPSKRELYSKDGYLDFEKVMKSEQFQKGMDSVFKGLNLGNNIALMCTEKDPMDCHRAIMVARAFSLEGMDVKHILQDGQIQTQQELDERLLDKYFPNRTQLTLFNYNDIHNYAEDIRLAYIERNKEIGYRLPEKEKTLA